MCGSQPGVEELFTFVDASGARGVCVCVCVRVCVDE